MDNHLTQRAIEEHAHFNAYVEAGNQIFTTLKRYLEQKSRYSIDRVIVGGSIGKKTSLGIDSEPDYDVVFFINDVQDVSSTVKDFHTLLNNLPRSAPTSNGSHLLTGSLKKTLHSVQLCVVTTINVLGRQKRVEINFDLLPAVNFSTNTDAQTQMALNKMESNRANWYHWSPCLAERTVKFVKDQPEWVHHVIRLARLWDKKLQEDMTRWGQNSHFSGRKSFVELVAIEATKPYGSAQERILKAFQKFLELMQHPSSVNVNFCGLWRQKNPFGTHGPLVVDSVNPFNNYAEALDQVNSSAYANRARETLLALKANNISAVNNFLAS